MGGHEFFLAWWVLHPVATGSTSLAPPGEPPEHQRWLLVSLRPDWSKHRRNRNSASDRDSQITTGNQNHKRRLTHERGASILCATATAAWLPEGRQSPEALRKISPWKPTQRSCRRKMRASICREQFWLLIQILHYETPIWMISSPSSK